MFVKVKKYGGNIYITLTIKDLAEGIKVDCRKSKQFKILAQKGAKEIISKFNSEILIKNY